MTFEPCYQALCFYFCIYILVQSFSLLLFSGIMSLVFKLSLFGGILSAVWLAWLWQKDVPIPDLKDEWWAAGTPKPIDEKIRPFQINIADEILDDLKERLNRSVRSVPPLEGIGFHYGFNTEYLKKIHDYWMNSYDWRKQEAFLNTFPQFITNINGLDIHFIHSQPKKELVGKKKVLPLLLLHGWPGSFIEFTKVIPFLQESKDHDFVFDIVVPSLPGYGFSDPARKPGMNPAEMAVIFDRLMKRLGHSRYYIQGGDWGSLISSVMATIYPQRVIGLHLNMLALINPSSNIVSGLGSLWPSLLLPTEKVQLLYPLSSHYIKLLQETGYMHLQATKPDTIGVALSDSPIGLAAYILEKFSTWTKYNGKLKTDGDLLEKFTLDELINNIMIYWVTNSITSSMRLYSEAFSAKFLGYKLDSVVCNVPTGVAIFPEELFIQPEMVAKLKYKRLISFNFMERGGHFAAYEEPLLLAQDVLQFIDRVEKL